MSSKGRHVVLRPKPANYGKTSLFTYANPIFFNGPRIPYERSRFPLRFNDYTFIVIVLKRAVQGLCLVTELY